MPTSSPKMTRIFGRRAGGAGICCCACAGLSDATDARADAATSDVPLNSRSRRLRPAPSCGADWDDCPLLRSSCIAVPFSDHATKSDVAGGGIDRLRMPGCRPVAAAIVRRAQVRAAFEDFARDLDGGLARIEAVLLAPAARVLGDAAGLGSIG